MIAVMVRFRHRFGFRNVFQCACFTVVLAVVGYTGAKSLYILENLDDGIRSNLTLTGMSMFGGVWFVPIFMPFVAKIIRIDKDSLMDACGPCGAIILGFMRIGCFMSGCCGATPIIISNECAIVLPIQLLEAAFDFYLAHFLLHSQKYGANNGMGFFVAMVGYGIARFFLEFMRDTPKINGFLSHGQWFAIITVIVGFAMLWARQETLEQRSANKRKRRK